MEQGIIRLIARLANGVYYRHKLRLYVCKEGVKHFNAKTLRELLQQRVVCVLTGVHMRHKGLLRGYYPFKIGLKKRIIVGLLSLAPFHARFAYQPRIRRVFLHGHVFKLLELLELLLYLPAGNPVKAVLLGVQLVEQAAYLVVHLQLIAFLAQHRHGLRHVRRAVLGHCGFAVVAEHAHRMVQRVALCQYGLVLLHGVLHSYISLFIILHSLSCPQWHMLRCAQCRTGRLSASPRP